MLQPKYMRDQFRLPQCMTPRQIRRQKKGNLQQYFDVSGDLSGDPNWYPQFQLFPNVWDELCTSPTGKGSAIPFNDQGRKFNNDTLIPMRGIKLCTHLVDGTWKARSKDHTMSYLNATITTANQFEIWKNKRLLLARDWTTTFGKNITDPEDSRIWEIGAGTEGQTDWIRTADPRICHIYPDKDFKIGNQVFNPFKKCWQRKMGPKEDCGPDCGLGLWTADPVVPEPEPEEPGDAGAAYVCLHILLFLAVLLL
jgi:hypothetical protein